jgi:integrase/recombinase XerD
MSTTNAFRAVRKLARDAGVTKHVTPHTLRHTAATLALAGGAPLHKVQDMLGHADPRTTRRYDRTRGALDGHAPYTLAVYLGGTA